VEVSDCHLLYLSSYLKILEHRNSLLSTSKSSICSEECSVYMYEDEVTGGGGFNIWFGGLVSVVFL
jgi:hypothetical protein